MLTDENVQDVSDIVEDVIGGPKSALTTDNYESAVSMLGDFATAGSVGAASEQRRDERDAPEGHPSQGNRIRPTYVHDFPTSTISPQMFE